MQLLRYRFTADWQPGTFSNSRLDTTVNVSQDNHPALTPTQGITTTTTETGAQAVGATQPAGTGLPSVSKSNTQGQAGALWQAEDVYGSTTQAGDALTFSTTALQVTLGFAGLIASPTAHAEPPSASGLASAQIRNGAVASVLVDGALVAAIDTYLGTPSLTLYLDGASHSVQVVHSGGYAAALQPISSVRATVGTTVATTLAPTAQYHPTFVAASWRVAATASNAYSLYKTLPGSAETLVASGLLAGQHYTGSSYVPGVDLYVATSSALTVGDGATFTTDVVMLAVTSLAVGTGMGGGASTYTSPILDAGQVIQWMLAEWDESVPCPSFTLAVGTTPAPDASWTSVTVTPTETVLPSGRRVGMAPLGAYTGMRGQYAQWTLTLPPVAITPPWVRDLALYGYDPETDLTLVGPLGLPPEAVPGPVLSAFQGWQNVLLTARRAQALDVTAGLSIGGAIDAPLRGYGADLGLPAYTGEQPQSYRARLQMLLQLRRTGPGLPGLCQQIAQLVTGSAAGLSTTVSGGYTTSTCQGVVVAQRAGQQYGWTIPAPPYRGMPGLSVTQAQQVIKDTIVTITPVGSVITPGTTLGQANPTTINVTFT